MRWAPVLAFISLVCSVLSTESGEPKLNIRAKLSVNNVGEKKGIYCEGTNLVEPMEWYSPLEKKVDGKSTKNTRVFVEKHEEPVFLALIIKSTKLEDSGFWTCKSGEVNATIQIIVGEKVNMNVRQETLEADEGRSVKLTCEAKGIPPPVVLWYFDGIAIPELPSKYTISQKDDTYSLDIKNLTHMDSGEYMCKVTQKALSHYTDKTIKLSIHHKPIIFNYDTRELSYSKYKTEEELAVIGDSKNITCSAIANPPPTFVWYRRINNFDKVITDTDLIVLSEDKMSSSYLLRMNDENDKGLYKCTATNPKGKVTVIFDVTPGQKPFAPTEISVVGANETFLTFNVTCANCTFKLEEPTPVDPDNLPVIGYTFDLIPYQEGYLPDWEKAEEFSVNIQDPNNTLFSVGPLFNSTQYNVRVRTRNAAGLSDELVMETIPETTSAAIQLVETSLLLLVALMITTRY